MAPKGGNSKKEAGRAKKAENEAKKRDAADAERERKEAAQWAQGAKADKQAEARAKAEAAAARKAEAARLLAEEEARIGSAKPKPPKAAKSKPASAPVKGKAKATVEPRPVVSTSGSGSIDAVIESFSASNIDDALDLMEVVNAKTDKASVGAMAGGLERHPERRFKAAFEAYMERELPELKKERPGLRLNQYKDLMFKNFQKHPDNPFNQVTVAYDATKEERVEALKKRQEQVEERLREKKGM